MSDASTSMVGTIEVGDKDRLDLDTLGAWMMANVPGYAGPSPGMTTERKNADR